MKQSMINIMAAVLLLYSATYSQYSKFDSLQNAESIKPVQLAGPRLGVTLIFGPMAGKLKEKFNANPYIVQFGWQEETRFFSVKNGPTGVTEFIFLVGGFEQGLLLPSLSWVTGIRTARGTEFGFGPNISLSGASLLLAFGVTKQSGSLNFPFNISIVTSKVGTRISFLFGFNARGVN